MKKRERLLNAILPLISVICMLVLWVSVSLAVDSEYIFPSISATFSELFSLLTRAEFYTAFFMTLLRSVIAFFVSFVLALLLALLTKKSVKATKIISPVISVIRSLPTVAVVLLLLFWVNKFTAPIIVTLLVVLPTLYTNLFNALFSVDDEQFKMCKIFGVSKKEVIFKVQLPQIMPSMLRSVGSGLALNVKLMVAAEVISATSKSMGRLLSNAQYNAEIAQMFALVLTCVLVGLIIETLFNLIAKKVGKWQ